MQARLTHCPALKSPADSICWCVSIAELLFFFSFPFAHFRLVYVSGVLAHIFSCLKDACADEVRYVCNSLTHYLLIVGF